MQVFGLAKLVSLSRQRLVASSICFVHDCIVASFYLFFASVPAFGWLGMGRWLVIRCWFLLFFDDRWWLFVVVVVAVVVLVVVFLSFVLGCRCCWRRRRFLFAFHIAARSVKTRRVSQASRPAAGLFVRADLGMTDLGSHKPRSFNSVDGRNPAPPGMYKNPVNNGINYILISWLAGFLWSTVR